jgi:hypothetical protein
MKTLRIQLLPRCETPLTPLSWAEEIRHEAAVKLLDDVDRNSKDKEAATVELLYQG